MAGNKIYKDNSEYKSQYMSGSIAAGLFVSVPKTTDNGFTVKLTELVNETENVFDLLIEAEKVSVSACDEQIAYIIAGLVLQKYVSIHFCFGISKQTLDDIAGITGAVVTSDEVLNEKSVMTARSNFSVNISGGMDSVALYKLCPELIPISIKFLSDTDGGNESKRISTELGSTIINSNMSEFLLPHYSYGYFNAGSLLLADSMGVKYAANGKILGDTLDIWEFIKGKKASPVENLDVDIYGVKTIYPLLGFTKVGVYKLLHNLDNALYEKMVSGWLENSVNDEHENGSARIRLLMDAAVTGEMRNVSSPLPRVSWEFNAVYSYYLAYKLGISEVSYWIYNVPSDTQSVLKSISMGWAEKYDQNMLQYLPEDFREYFVECLENAGVEFYTDEDYENRINILRAAGGDGISPVVMT